MISTFRPSRGGPSHFRVLLLVMHAVALLAPLHAWALETVTLQLKWRHQFQFAGYYAAVEQGYYRDAGLDVRFLEANAAEDDPIRVVGEGRAEYGVGSSDLVLAAARGEPVLLLAAVYQHSPLVFITREATGIRSVHDLIGKRVAMESTPADLLAYLRREGVALERLIRVPHAFSVEPMLRGEVDAISGYITDEPFDIQAHGERAVVLDPRVAGIDFYGDTLFTTQTEFAQHPERVRAFREASLRGWRWALAHPEQTIDLILSKYSTRHTRAQLQFEAEQTRRLVQPDIIEIGYINPRRIHYILSIYSELGVGVSPPPDLTSHIYDAHPMVDIQRWLYALAALIVALAAALLVLWRYRSMVKRLRAAEQQSLTLVEQLREQAMTDALTGLANRRACEARATVEFARAVRGGQPLTLLLLDIDFFKRINDTDGHQVGDQVLAAVGAQLVHLVRTTDLAARVGGEEFAVLATDTGLEGARQLAERIREAVAAQTVATDNGPRQVTVTVGVANYQPEIGEFRELWRRADVALYRGKGQGRNRVSVWHPGASDQWTVASSAPEVRTPSA